MPDFWHNLKSGLTKRASCAAEVDGDCETCEADMIKEPKPEPPVQKKASADCGYYDDNSDNWMGEACGK